MTMIDGCRGRPIRRRSRRAPARSSRSTSATPRAPISAAGAPAALVLLQAVELARGIRRHHRAARRHRAARLRGRDRARHRHRRPAGRARATPGGTWLGHRLERLRRSTTCARTTRARTSGRRAATASRRSARRSSTPARSTPRAASAHVGERRARAGRHDRRAALPPRPARRRPLAALHPRARRRHPHGHAGRVVRRRAPETSSRSRSTCPAGRSSGRLVTHRHRRAPSRSPALGALPAVDDEQRAEAWGSREAAGLPPRSDDPSRSGDQRSIGPATGEVGPEPGEESPGLERRAAREAPRRPRRRALSAQLRKRGLNNVTIDGVARQPHRHELVGTAKTLRFVPGREDLFASHGGGYNAQKRAFDAVGAGEVHRHRGPRRARLRHPRRHPRAARLRPRRGRHRHRRRGARLRRRRRHRHPRLLRRTRTPRCWGASTCRGTSTSRSDAAARPCSRATSSSATATA